VMSALRDDEPPPDLPAALHEVGNALTVVVGWIDLALASLQAGHPASEPLEVARGRAARAQRLARRAIGAERDLDPPRMVGDLVRELTRGLEGTRSGVVRIESALDDGLESARLHRGESAGQVLLNLVLNAVQVSRAGGVVRIGASPGGDGFLVLTVSDQGPGVPPELRDSLFDGGRSSRPGGAGIGLRHAAGLAAEVGGSLALSDGAGDGAASGAVFSLRWPLARPPTLLDEPDDPFQGPSPPTWPPGVALRADGSDAPASSARPTLAGSRVLLVEDDPAVRDLLETALLARGVEVQVVSDAAGLPGALAQAAYDAALVDLSPLGTDVAGALTSLRSHSPLGRLVVISASVAATPDLPQVDAWVRKPFEVDDVLRALVAAR
jgi:CheY-like chemotaxis protein